MASDQINSDKIKQSSSKNSELMREAEQYFPGGVNSPVRSFSAVGGSPLVAISGSGPLLRDSAGHDYVDLCCSWGALPLGHADPRVQKLLLEQVQCGFSFGMPTLAENLLAKRLQELLPQLERMRFVNSGTEAVMSALRVARAHTQRDLVLKFEGCYHGHADYLLVEAGSGAAEAGQTARAEQVARAEQIKSRPSSSGIPERLASLCEALPYNDLASVQEKLGSEKFAAVIVEPIAANMGLVLPEPGFLEGLRAACDQSGTLLVFDEVITGLRLPCDGRPGSAAAYFAVQPDLSCFGKAVGGGLPFAVYGGAKELMQLLSPEGDCYQAGTLSGNPLAALAGLATIEGLVEDWPRAYPLWQDFIGDLQRLLEKGKSHALASCGSLLTIYLGAQKSLDRAPRNFTEAKELAGQKLYPAFFHFLLERDIYLSPSPYEALFLSTAHDAQTLDFVLSQLAEYVA